MTSCCKFHRQRKPSNINHLTEVVTSCFLPLSLPVTKNTLMFLRRDSTLVMHKGLFCW